MKIRTTPEKIREAFEFIGQRGSVQGSPTSGRFSVSGVEGRYFYEEDTGILSVTITDKPWLVSLDYVESEFKKFFK